MNEAIRRAIVPITLAFALALVASACSDPSESGAVGTSGQLDDSAIGLDITSGLGTITVQNRTTYELVGMRVAINVNQSAPPALRGPYITNSSRLAPGTTRVFSLGEFTANGARINLNSVRPREVVVTASGFEGKKHEVSLPWKP